MTSSPLLASKLDVNSRPEGSIFFICVFVFVACVIKKRVSKKKKKKKRPRTGGACATRATCELRPCVYKHNPTLSANKHVVQICRSSRQQSQRLCPSPLHVPRFQQRCLCTSRRDACDRISAIQAVLKGRTVAIRKKINIKLINLVYSSCLKHANNLPLGDQWQADQRTQSFHFAVVIHQSLDPAARSSAQAPSSLSLLSLHEFRALTDRLRTRRRVGSTRRRGNHMHDHSRFQRDIDDVTGVSLSLSPSHKSHSRTI